jgi:hypothetical protein
MFKNGKSGKINTKSRPWCGFSKPDKKHGKTCPQMKKFENQDFCLATVLSSEDG